jgi:hypothetical protein
MSKSHKAFALVILAFVIAGGVAVGIWHASPVRRQGGLLTGAEITALVSGNTVKGAKFSEYYAPDGSIRGREIEDEDEEYLGTWHVEGDRLCVAFPSQDYTSCVAVIQDKDSEYTFGDGGSPGKRTILNGNPSNL